jgi:hypothetical protein
MKTEGRGKTEAERAPWERKGMEVQIKGWLWLPSHPCFLGGSVGSMMDRRAERQS